MRKLSAHYIFPSNQAPLKYGILILDDNGRVLDLIDTGGKLKEESQLEFYPGILTPGFVNAHCHLELSHMLNIIPEKTGMTGFIDRISRDRIDDEIIINREIKSYVDEVYRTGTSAVADIVNTDHSLAAKLESPIYWHSFVELFGLRPENAERIWNTGKNLKRSYINSGLSASISPHAPYSISRELWKFLKSESPEMLTIHNQESRDEEALMTQRRGKLAEWYIQKGYNFASLPEQKESSLKSYIEYLPQADRYLFVHNTYSSDKDFDFAGKYLNGKEVYWVMCPNANLYIENSLPNKLIEQKSKLNICIGTDSLASNKSLSMLEEMKTVQNNFQDVNLKEILRWSTSNGASALGIEKEYGSFEKGKQPGVVWIDNIDFEKLALTDRSKSKRLV